ncbi:unnamed protein product [Adineta steineri]|uniref:Uncharacterized protein n=1 Tax=Adineta steineri TaxID=433720 RepID=A0A815N7N9_9BILA|nr:unnamed protein product [Adineta steineri]CAF4155343.1 unnamed protein product [Adineta steineri]
MRWLALLYEANISIFDSSSNQWMNGRIRRHFKFFGDQYTIEWNEETQFRRRWISLLRMSKYDLEIFSKQIPDAIYILALATKDHNTAQASKRSRLRRKTG